MKFESEIITLMHHMNKCNIEFVVIGGFAKYIYGYTTELNDYDFFLPKEKNKSNNIIRFLNIYNPHLRWTTYDFKEIIRIRLNNNIKIDLLPKLDGVDNSLAYTRSVVKKIEFLEIKVLDKNILDLNSNFVKRNIK